MAYCVEHLHCTQSEQGGFLISAVVQGLELCKHTSLVGMLPCFPWSEPALCQVREQEDEWAQWGCETILPLSKCKQGNIQR